jgi:hypothetical protein
MSQPGSFPLRTRYTYSTRLCVCDRGHPTLRGRTVSEAAAYDRRRPQSLGAPAVSQLV